MRRRLVVMVVVIGLMLFAMTPAFADGWAVCSTGGYGYTYSSNFADHKFGDDATVQNVKGTVGHGWEIGNHWWIVNNPNPPSESGQCVV